MKEEGGEAEEEVWMYLFCWVHVSYSSPVVSFTLYVGGGRVERLARQLNMEGMTRFSLLTFKPKDILNPTDVETHFDNFHWSTIQV